MKEEVDLFGWDLGRRVCLVCTYMTGPPHDLPALVFSRVFCNGLMYSMRALEVRDILFDGD